MSVCDRAVLSGAVADSPLLAPLFDAAASVASALILRCSLRVYREPSEQRRVCRGGRAGSARARVTTHCAGYSLACAAVRAKRPDADRMRRAQVGCGRDCEEACLDTQRGCCTEGMISASAAATPLKPLFSESLLQRHCGRENSKIG